MRVAIVTHSSNLEGAERSVLEVIKRLVDEGNKILVLVRETGDFTSVLKEKGVEFHKLEYGWWSTEGDTFSKTWLQSANERSEEIARVLIAFEADLVYTNTSVIPYGALSAVKAGLPHVWHIRELASGKVFDSCRAALNKIGSLISLASNCIVFNSDATRKSWEPFLRDKSGTQVIYNPIPTGNFLDRYDDRVFRVALVGSILPIKKQMEALEAFAKDMVKDSNIELEIIGPVRNESYFNKLKEFISENGIESKVSFKGFQENPFSGLPDLCLVCGNTEGFGRTIAEAIMNGIPVLAAKGGATDELINEGETGFLYEPDNINQLAERLLELSEQKLDDHVARARNNLSEKLSDEETLQKLIKLMRAVSVEENPLYATYQFLNPFDNHEEHLRFIKSADLLKEIIRRKTGLL